ncbi:MAG TPA: sugar transferase [Thermoanaerobaculia bacterium]|nr:sugar transferase [Thermoanaerobaculia bacterium]
MTPETGWVPRRPASPDEPSRSTGPINFAFIGHFAHSVIALPVGLWGFLDMVTAVAAVHFSHQLSPSFGLDAAAGLPWNYRVSKIQVVFAVAVFLSSYAMGLYSRQNFNFRLRIVKLCLGANIAAIIMTTLYFSWFDLIPIGRYILLFMYIFAVFGTMSMRLIARDFAGRRKIRVVFVGAPAKFDYLRDEMAHHYGALYDTPFCLDLSKCDYGRKAAEVLNFCSMYDVDEIVVEDDAELLLELLHDSAAIISKGVSLRSSSAFHEELLHEVPVDTMDCRGLLGAGWGVGRKTTEIGKRALDISLALIGLLVSLPILVAVAIVIRGTSRGSVLYRQSRVGRFGSVFNIYKFRTMKENSEPAGPVWASLRDDRATGVGRFLRRSRLDELPQLWNVLNGNMSLVGPRPERPEFVSELERSIPYYHLRHLVPPGLTGWAQIRYPYGSTVEDARRKLCYDLYYVRHYGPAFDIAICLKTVLAMARGAR